MIETPLVKELERLKIHDHACFLYETHEEWQACISNYIKIGLERGEKCLYVYDIHNGQEIRAALKRGGINTIQAESAGNLVIKHGHRVFMKDGLFDPDWIISFLTAEVKKTLAEGYTALRLTGERDWAARGLLNSQKFKDYETRLDRDLLSRYPCLDICQYDCSSFDPEFVKSLISIHSKLIRNNRVCSNHYYVSTEKHFDITQAEKSLQFIYGNIEREDKRERELQETSQKFWTLFKDSSSIIWITDENGQYLDANKAALDFLECSRKELLDKTVWSFYPPEDLENRKLKYSPFLSSRNGNTEYLVNGRKKTLLLNEVPMTSGEQRMLFGIGQDITQYNKMVEALQESEKKYRTLVNNLKLGVFRTTHDPQGRFLEINQAMETITGYSREELLKIKVIDLYARPEDRKTLIGKIISSPQFDTYELHFVKKDKKQIVVAITMCAIKEETGKLPYFDGVLADITELKLREERRVGRVQSA